MVHRDSRAELQFIIEDIFQRHQDNGAGEVANYIPELAKANPNDFAISIATIHGESFSVGNANHPFTIQSCSKPLIYGLARESWGKEKVDKHVGAEPTGRLFNDLILDEKNNRPFNPLVNAGAISMTSLLHDQYGQQTSSYILDSLSRMAGRQLTYNEDVFLSEKKTGHMNRAIAYLMHDKEIINNPVEEKLDTYFQQCAIEVTALDLAKIAVTLANVGDNPETDDKILSPKTVRDTLSIMFTCGMYNYSGQWALDVGVPAKSGVGGGIMAVINRQVGIGIYSPLLDERGNSVRGIKACIDLVEELGLHAFEFSNLGSSILGSYLK